jgi:cytidylate kinase
MATLSSGPRINARSTPRIHESIKRNCIELSDRGLTFEGRQVSAEALVSALLKCYLDLTIEEQVSMMTPALKDLESELEEMNQDCS